jgi:predicted  nucleic acid-binding Zn-ribbon protein
MIDKKPIFISDLHFEHKLWISELLFWQDEIGTFKHRLEEIVERFEDNEVLAKVEKYQNQFIRHREVIDTLKHDIKAAEHTLAVYAAEHPEAVNKEYFEDHESLRDRMETQRKLYGELKTYFLNFLRKVI